MNNRHDSNVKDFEGRQAGTGANAKPSKGDSLVKGGPRRDLAKPYHDGSPRDNGKGNHA